MMLSLLLVAQESRIWTLYPTTTAAVPHTNRWKYVRLKINNWDNMLMCPNMNLYMVLYNYRIILMFKKKI